MKIIITIANDVATHEVTKFMKDLDNEILNKEEYKSIIEDIKVVPQ